jgi:hypothetical protein
LNDDARYDLVVANFFFDSFTEDSMEKIVRQIAVSTRPGAIWMVSDFGEPGAGLSGWRAGLILKSLYLFFGLLAKIEARFLTSPDEALMRNGFVFRERKKSDWGLFQSTLWQRPEAVVMLKPS